MIYVISSLFAGTALGFYLGRTTLILSVILPTYLVVNKKGKLRGLFYQTRFCNVQVGAYKSRVTLFIK